MGMMRRQMRRRTIVGAAMTASMVSGARKNRAERKAIESMNDQQGQQQQAAVDPTEELAKYKKLLDSGAITQEEYDKKKAELLGL
jgi:membrane protease subunit (stomatin/prohibitin family)